MGYRAGWQSTPPSAVRIQHERERRSAFVLVSESDVQSVVSCLGRDGLRKVSGAIGHNSSEERRAADRDGHLLALMLFVITSANPGVMRSPVALDETLGRKQPEGLRFAFAGRPKGRACAKRECPEWRCTVFRPSGTN